MTIEELIISLAKEIIRLKSDVEFYKKLWLDKTPKKEEVEDESNE